jgi:hypothetical protein
MSDLDPAKLRRLQAAAASALARVPEESARGLPPTYNAIRDQVALALPAGLIDELEAIAPRVISTTTGPHAIIEASNDGAKAFAHLAALKGWLEAILESK